MTALRGVAATFAAVALSIGLALGLVAADIVPAEAASNLAIIKVRADSPGPDNGSNASKNAEYVVIKNNSKKSIKLGGYTLRDASNASKHVYRFPAGFVLKPGKTVTLRTGSGKNTASQLYWGQRWYVWNNTGDTARLQRNGKTVNSFTYKAVNATGFGIRR
jgi:hypothetical protein